MKITRPKLNKKLLLALIGLLVAVVVIGTVAYFRLQNVDTTKSNNGTVAKSDIDLEPPTNDEIDLGNQQKTNTVNSAPEAEQPSISDSLDISFTALNQNGDTVQIRSLSTQNISGSCKLTAVNKTVSKSYTAPTQSYANSTTCAGFDIPVSDLGGGTWNLILLVTSSDGKTGSSSAKIEVKA